MAKRRAPSAIKPSAAAIARGLSLTKQPTAARDAMVAAAKGTAWTRDSLVNMVSGLGTNFDKRTSNQYLPTCVLSRMDLDNAFRSSWAAGRVVTTVPDDMTREGWSTSWDGHDDDVEAPKALSDAERFFGVNEKVNEALKWARLYGGSAIVPMIRGDVNLDQPLDLSKIKLSSLQSLHVLDRWWIAPTGEVDREWGSPNFGLPKYYTISDASASVPHVHWSRVIRFNGRKVPKQLWLMNGMWDDSELQNVMESIKDYDFTRANIASMVPEASVDIIMQQGLADALSAPDTTAIVTARMQAAATQKSSMRMMALDKESEEYKQKNITFAGLKDVMQDAMTDLCGAADIPMTRFFGQSPAGMTATGESDMRNYYDHVAADQRTKMLPQLYRLYSILMLSAIGYMPKGFLIECNPLWQMSDKERGEINFQQAQADNLYINNGTLHPGVVARQLQANGTYSVMEDEDVQMAEELAKEPPPPAPGALPPKGPSKGAIAAPPATKAPPKAA